MLPTAVVAGTLEPLIAMAEAGRGLTCVPVFTVRQKIAEGALREVLADHFEPIGKFRILWPSSRHLSPKIKAFVDFMSQNLFANEKAASAVPAAA